MIPNKIGLTNQLYFFKKNNIKTEMAEIIWITLKNILDFYKKNNNISNKNGEI